MAGVLSVVLFVFFVLHTSHCTLLNGLETRILTPDYIDMFEAAASYSHLPTAVQEDKLQPLERAFWKKLIEVFQKIHLSEELQKEVADKLTVENLSRIRSEALHAFSLYSSLRSENIGSYQNVPAEVEKNALMVFEETFVRKVNEVLKGGPLTIPTKHLKVALIGAQRDSRDRGHNVIFYMSLVGIVSALISMLSGVYFMVLKQQGKSLDLENGMSNE